MNKYEGTPTVLFGKTYMWRMRTNGQWQLIRVEFDPVSVDKH